MLTLSINSTAEMARTIGLVVGAVVLMWFAEVGAVPEAALVTGVPGFSGVFPSKHYAG